MAEVGKMLFLEHLLFYREFRTLCVEIELLLTGLFNFEREAILKDSAF